MRPAARSRTINAVAISIAAHAFLLTVLALHAPKLFRPPEPTGPPQPIIPVLIMPRVPPAEAGGPPAPIRLHRRPQRLSPDELPLEPLVVPEAEADQTRAEGPRVIAPPQDDAVTTNVRQALRGGRVGCANARALGLSREEREECDRKLARGAKDAEFPGLGLDREKDSALARAAAEKDAYIRYRNGGVPPGTSGGPGDSGQPWKVVIPPTR